MTTTSPVIVIGGGISGLACAYHLQQLGSSIVLLETANQVGGLIGTVEKDGFLFESGPQSFQGTETLLRLASQLGIEGELQKADPRAPRYILRHGHLQKIPMSPQAMLSSSFLGANSRWKIASEPFRRTRPPTNEESVADFVRRKFGHEILEYLVSPFVSGVYAGDPEKLSLRAAFPTLENWEREYGSVVRGAIKSRSSKNAPAGPPPLCSFRRGLGTFTNSMAGKLGKSVRTGANVTVLNRNTAEGGGFTVRFNQGGNEEMIAARAVIFATPAYIAAHLVAAFSESLRKTLSSIQYAPVAVVSSGYFDRQIGQPIDGFGVLIPRSERLRTLGTVWNSSLFPGRSPEGSVAITSFVGGATDSDIMDHTDEEIATIVQTDNARVLGITGSPIASAVWKHAKALPQYNLGHGHLVEAIRQDAARNPGLFFAGNYLEGPSLGKCVEQAYQTAEAAHRAS